MRKNLEKKIHFIRNFFKEEKVKNYYESFESVKSDIANLILLANSKNFYVKEEKKIKVKVKLKIMNNLSF